MENSVVIIKKKFKREGAAGWVGISKKPEPRFDYPVPCLNDVVDIREIAWIHGGAQKIELRMGICIVYGMTRDLIICKKVCDNGAVYDISYRKKEFMRGGLLFRLADQENKERVLIAMSN